VVFVSGLEGVWGRASNSGPTIGASTPVDDLGFIDLKAVVVVSGETWGRPDGTVDVEDDAATSTHQMVVVVTHAVLVTSNRASGLYPADETLVDEEAERVVYRLSRDGADLPPHGLGQLFGGGMGACGDSFHDGQTLGSDLEIATSQLLHDALLLDRIWPAGLLRQAVVHSAQVKHILLTKSRIRSSGR